MEKYHKIQNVFKRDHETNCLTTEFSRPEFGYLAYLEWEWTEKVDGMNIRVMQNPVHTPLKFAGKTDKAQLPPKLLNKLRERFGEESDHERLGSICADASICLYGEGYGAGIQKGGGYIPEGQDFVLFDVMIAGTWLGREDVEGIANDLSLPVVPVVGSGSLLSAVELVEVGFKSAWGDVVAEGLVARPVVELSASNGQRIITKIKRRDFVSA